LVKVDVSIYSSVSVGIEMINFGCLLIFKDVAHKFSSNALVIKKEILPFLADL
jgi:hypothetical protein